MGSFIILGTWIYGANWMSTPLAWEKQANTYTKQGPTLLELLFSCIEAHGSLGDTSWFQVDVNPVKGHGMKEEG